MSAVSPSHERRIAVVIITRDRVRELLHTLARICELPERPQVVVVDHGSRDGTAAAVTKRFADVEVIELDGDRGAAGRTVGARHADAQFIAFCDDDSWWAPGALARGAALLAAHPKLAVVAGRVLVGRDRVLDPVCAEMAASPLRGGAELPGRPVLGFVACGAIVRRSAYLEAGGFDPRFGVGAEEQLLAVDLAARGWRLVYRGDVIAYHHPSPVRDHFRRRVIQVRNELWFAWMRRRRRALLGIALAAAGRSLHDPAARAGVLQALRGARSVAADRRPVPAWLEAQLTQLTNRTCASDARECRPRSDGRSDGRPRPAG
jgi:GT2 family glycosyltransferase